MYKWKHLLLIIKNTETDVAVAVVIVVVGLVFVVGVVAAVVGYWLAIVEFDCSPCSIPTVNIP